MEQPIQDRRGQYLISEDDSPVRNPLVRRDQQAPFLVSAVYQLEEQVRRSPLEWQVAQLVDDQQPELAVLDQLVPEVSFRFGFPQDQQQCRGRREANRMTLLHDLAAQANCQV